MMTRMDLEIGKVLKQLEAMGAERNTVIIFLSANGVSSEQLRSLVGLGTTFVSQKIPVALE
jgi:arylsulfatase A-like enzyme